MQLLEYLSLLQKHGLSYAIFRISFPSSKTWTIICNFWNFFPFSKNTDYHMQLLEFLYHIQSGLSYAILEIHFPFKNMDYHMQFLKFLSLLKKCGLSYAISLNYFPSPKTWTIICNFWNLFSFSKNMDYHMQFLKFLSLQKL